MPINDDDDGDDNDEDYKVESWETQNDGYKRERDNNSWKKKKQKE